MSSSHLTICFERYLGFCFYSGINRLTDQGTIVIEKKIFTHNSQEEGVCHPTQGHMGKHQCWSWGKRSEGKAWTGVFFVVFARRNRWWWAGLELDSLSNANRLWATGIVTTCPVPGFGWLGAGMQCSPVPEPDKRRQVGVWTQD